jgi:hypothetical protein
MERDNSEDRGLGGMIILKWNFGKWDREAWSGLLGLWTGTGGELSGSIKCG